MSYHSENRKDYYHEDRRQNDYRGRRDNGGGGGPDRSSSQACFYCKEVGHRIMDCPKKSKSNQRNGNNGGFRNNKYNNGNNNSYGNSNYKAGFKKEQDNFQYEDNCPPPEDEDWGGGEDSEEERKKKKKEEKRAKKKIQLEQESQMNLETEKNNDQEWESKVNQNQQQYTKVEEEQQPVTNGFMENFRKEGSQVNQVEEDEDWGGKEYDNPQRENNEQDNLGNFELSLEDQIKAQFAGVLPVHASRTIEEPQRSIKEFNPSDISRSFNRGKSNERHRESSRERSRRDSSREKQWDKYDKSLRQRSNENSGYKKDENDHFSERRERRDDKYRKEEDRYKRGDDNNYRREGEDRSHKREYNDRFKRDDDKYRRYEDKSKSRHNDHEEKKPLRDNQWSQQYNRRSMEKLNKMKEEHQDDITDKINEMLTLQAFGGGQQIDFSSIENKAQEEEVIKEREPYEEWTMDDIKDNNNTAENDQKNKKENGGGFYIKKEQSENVNNDDEDWGGGGNSHKENSSPTLNRKSYSNHSNNNYNSSSSYNYNSNNNKGHHSNYSNNFNSNYNNRQKANSFGGDRHNFQYKNNNRSRQSASEAAIVILSDDDNDQKYKASPQRNHNSSSYNKRNANTTSSSQHSKSATKAMLTDLLNSNPNNPSLYPIYDSPPYEPNKESDDENKNQNPILFNPDEHYKREPKVPNDDIKDLNSLSIENYYNFNEEEEQENGQNLTDEVQFKKCVLFYNKIPSIASDLKYDRHQSFFEEKLLKDLYPHKSHEGNCLKVYEGDLKMRRFTESGHFSIVVKAQVYTNLPWGIVKWIPSLRILKGKEKSKEFSPIEYDVATRQLTQIAPKEKYERVFYLYWVEGQTQEDDDKIEEYTNYLYTKKLLAGVNLENGCYTMASMQQLFPSIESYTRADQFKKKTPIKMVLVYNQEASNLVTYKNVPF